MRALRGKRILLCVGGGIAAYKAAELVRRLVGAEASVQVAMTRAATQFITPLTLQTLSRRPVASDLLSAAEDAAIALERGVDGLVVSNHGGRAEESGRSTIECLPEVAAAVRGRIPVLIDGGFRRGTDIFKALALGADAVGIGRPYLWGLAAFGQAGVEAVLKLLRRELEMVMRQAEGNQSKAAEWLGINRNTLRRKLTDHKLLK